MSKTYCGACRGERGCIDCNAVGNSVVYTGLTGFWAEDDKAEVSCGEVSEASESKNNSQYIKLFLAADLGTTTLAFVCADECGTVLASYGAENPQRKVAADVIGRIDAALHGQREFLVNAIREALAKGFLFVLQQAVAALKTKGIEDVELVIQVAIAGNTTMQHLLMDYPLEGMARAPFLPYCTEKITLPFSQLFSETTVYEALPEFVKKAEVMVFPCFSAFVGGDAIAGACAVFSHRARGARLLIDLGTNGELLLWVNGRLYGTSAAMGSAFEGGRYAYASDLFRLIAEALCAGVIDETGLLCEPYFTEGFLGLLQEDIREFQLAKGALRVGIEILCRYAGVGLSEVEQIFLAGGFGQYCRMEDLFSTGLLPKEFVGKVTFVGNSCIGGILSCFYDEKNMIYCEGEVLNLAEQPEFEELFYRCMNFEREG